jgi:hypothetical protein
VICGSEDELARIGTLIEGKGLDGPDAADLLGQVIEDVEASLAVAAQKVDAMLTRRVIPLPVPLLRFDETRVGELRGLIAPGVLAA